MLLDVLSVTVAPDFQLDLLFKNGERRRFYARPLLLSNRIKLGITGDHHGLCGDYRFRSEEITC
jgi:hypothetical protein